MRALAALVRGRRAAWSTLVLSLLGIAVAFALLPEAASDASPEAGLPSGSEAARVTELLRGFPSANTTAGLLLFTRSSGDIRADGAARDELTENERAAIVARVAALAQLSSAPDAVRPAFSEDGTAALIAVPLSAAEVDRDVDSAAAELREAAAEDLPGGLTARLTGPVGFSADVRDSFAGADVRLLLVTVGVVALLLLVTYRSPVLWIVPLVVVGAADGLSRFAVAALASALEISVDASVSGILSVLVFGAGTNYALLLVARYREELRSTEDRYTAMTTAVRAAGPAIIASGSTVTVSLLALLLAELAGNRALGIACAAGIILAMMFALIVLPAALVVCGRGIFWPFVPRPHTPAARPGLWERLGRGVSRRPIAVTGIAAAGIAVLCLGLGGYEVGLPQIDQLVGEPESVTAQVVLEDAFPEGGNPTTVLLTPDSAADDAAMIAAEVPGIVSATVGESDGSLTRIDVALSGEPESADAFTAVRALRNVFGVSTEEVGDTLVGGTDATALDVQDSAQRDLLLVAPIILGVVFLVLLLLLRSLVAPVLLLATVLATFFAALGASTWLFTHLLGFAALDTSVTLFAFLFLVALGVDYNIFLTTRAREERVRHGTREGMIRALAATGAVITSAGVLLAAVFAVLGVLPVVALTQVGTIVCIGVLLDTLVVRTVLVPALVFATGDRFWWPSGTAPLRGTG